MDGAAADDEDDEVIIQKIGSLKKQRAMIESRISAQVRQVSVHFLNFYYAQNNFFNRMYYLLFNIYIVYYTFYFKAMIVLLIIYYIQELEIRQANNSDLKRSYEAILDELYAERTELADEIQRLENM